jgi:hypothetical protein
MGEIVCDCDERSCEGILFWEISQRFLAKREGSLALPATEVQKRCGSLSSSSSEIQAVQRCSACKECSQAASRVVLPKPAGAETRVRRWCKLALESSSVKRGRAIKACEEDGIMNFVTANWSWIRSESLIQPFLLCMMNKPSCWLYSSLYEKLPPLYRGRSSPQGYLNVAFRLTLRPGNEHEENTSEQEQTIPSVSHMHHPIQFITCPRPDKMRPGAFRFLHERTLFQRFQPGSQGCSNIIRRVLLEIMQPSHDNRTLRGPGAAELMLTRL